MVDATLHEADTRRAQGITSDEHRLLLRTVYEYERRPVRFRVIECRLFDDLHAVIHEQLVSARRMRTIGASIRLVE
jgi:hypothetical protein